jgi:hypothetical protein
MSLEITVLKTGVWTSFGLALRASTDSEYRPTVNYPEVGSDFASMMHCWREMPRSGRLEPAIQIVS